MNRWFSNKNKYIAILIIFAYVFVGLYFLYSNINMHKMSHHHTDSSCTFVMGQNVLCGANILDFINKWKDIYSVNISYKNLIFITPFLLAYIPIIFVIILLFNLFLYIKKSFSIPILYNILFSKGILNSKAY